MVLGEVQALQLFVARNAQTHGHVEDLQKHKRGGGCPTLSLSETDSPSPAPDVDILDLNTALEELEKLDEFQSRIVELRYFAGLSSVETAEVTGISESSVKREWVVAKTWIRRRLLQEHPQP